MAVFHLLQSPCTDSSAISYFMLKGLLNLLFPWQLIAKGDIFYLIIFRQTKFASAGKIYTCLLY